MKSLFLPLSLCLLFYVSTAGQRATAETGVVTSVIDGDTIRVRIDRREEKVRLIGVNSPELKDPRPQVRCFAVAAKAFVEDRVENLTVKLESDPTQADRDRYGRLLRYVYWNKGNLNLYIIKQGFAYEYTYNRPYRLSAEFKAAQKYAEKSRWGLWDPRECSMPRQTRKL